CSRAPWEVARHFRGPPLPLLRSPSVPEPPAAANRNERVWENNSSEQGTGELGQFFAPWAFPVLRSSLCSRLLKRRQRIVGVRRSLRDGPHGDDTERLDRDPGFGGDGGLPGGRAWAASHGEIAAGEIRRNAAGSRGRGAARHNRDRTFDRARAEKVE